MRRIFVSVIFAFIAIAAAAVPAKPGKFRYVQPDGSILTLERHGDEYFHWTTDAEGRLMDCDEKGFYRRSRETLAARRARQSAPPKARWSSYDTAPETNFGDRKVLALLVEFSDTTFSITDPKARFTAMLNEKGYSYDGAYGSVKDFYEDNSLGLYRPVFDVYGPVRLPNTQAYYGNNDDGAQCLKDACALLDSEIDFSQYDTDSDGKVDMILFYYAGHNEAEQGVEASIWPHQGTTSGSFDGVNIGRFFCTSELRNADGKNMCGIGTTCHEFAHSLGLPDFYDTDYEKNGGQNFALGSYSTMNSGSYLDDGRRPCYFTAIERNMLGWMPPFPVLSESGHYTLEPVSQNKAYTHGSEVEGEYFVYEYRVKTGWDAFLPASGLVVCHVDKSQRIISGSYTAAYLWENTNKINVYGGKPCCYLENSGQGIYTYPSYVGVNSFSPVDKDNVAAGFILSNIIDTGSAAEFDFEVVQTRRVWGEVKDNYGKAIEGACVRIARSQYPFKAAPSLLSTDIASYTDSKGRYSIDIPSDYPSDVVLEASAEGMVTQGVMLDSEKNRYLEFKLFYQGETAEGLYKYDPSLTHYRFRFGKRPSVAVAARFTEEELSESGYAGGKVRSISFASPASVYSRILLVVTNDSEPLCVKDVTEGFIPDSHLTFSLAEEDITIPSSGDLYIGYAVTDVGEGTYPVYAYGISEENNGGAYVCTYTDGTSFQWTELKSTKGFLSPEVSVLLSRKGAPALSETGISSLSADVSSLKAGDGFIPELRVAEGKNVQSVKWFYDGVEVEEAPQTLTPGAHTWKTVIYYYDGTRETIFLDLDL